MTGPEPDREWELFTGAVGRWSTGSTSAGW